MVVWRSFLRRRLDNGTLLAILMGENEAENNIEKPHIYTLTSALFAPIFSLSKRRKTRRENMMLPTIHLNGTSPKTLLEDHLNALRAVQTAMEAIAAAAPNGRDFYPQGPDACGKAGVEHRERIARLKKVYDEMMAIAEHCSDAIDSRARR